MTDLHTPTELIVFDMAGTTVYDDDFVHRALQEALHHAGVEATRDDINAVMGRPKPLAIRSFLEAKHDESDALDAAVEGAHDDFIDRINAFYATDSAVREVEGVSDLFAQLQDAGIKVGLDTGFSRSTADVIIDRLGWDAAGLLDASVTSDEVDHGRPAPDMIYHLMEATGVDDVERVVKLGDAPSDLQEGDRAGCRLVIGVTKGSHTRDELAPYPHTHLIDTVADLPALLFAANGAA